MPVNSLPPLIWALAGLLAVIEVAFALGASGWVGGPAAAGWRVAAIQDWGFSPAVLEVILTGRDRSPAMLTRLVSYAGIHGSATHAIFGIVMLLALGKFVGEAFRALPTLALLLAGAIGGALLFALAAPALFGGNPALIGIYPAVYGLIGGFTYIMWLHYGRTGENQLRAFRFIGFLLALQLLFGALFDADPMWIADIGGFLSGLALAPLVAPGGWAAFRARIRG
jgi:membrane associated rhomboid family serine protease